MASFDDDLNGIRVSWDMQGDGPPVVLLHGFPQTRAMWHPIAPALARRFTVIVPDLRGYGDSGKPEGVAGYSFRAMAGDICALMDRLGHTRFDLVGHDRGARVAHRLALESPERIGRICLMDIVPTHTILSDLRLDVARAYYHWFFLAQPSPFPETLIGHDPDAYYHACLLGWGGASLSDFAPGQLDAYRAAWRRPETIHAMCNDYRATLEHDLADDSADCDTTLSCPALILFGADGVMAKSYDVPGVWRRKFSQMQARAIAGGHFFPDTNPAATCAALDAFLSL